MLNPITFTENVIGDFLRYQITAYPFADADLYAQMRALLNLEETRATPLMKGPYISLSRTFEQGAAVADLVSEGVLHSHLAAIAEHPHVYGHQEDAIRAIVAGHTTLVSTGTGSGKTETFLLPIISRCLQLRDDGTPNGITAVILYPMNALAEDQLGRLRELLAGSGVTFGMYIGKTPESRSDVSGIRLESGASNADYRAALRQTQEENRDVAVHPPEERVSRQEMRENPPRILLTNVKQLELLLTRSRDIELFDRAQLEFIVCDEAHTFSGAAGAETACLIRRLRAYCDRSAHETVCVATSATIVDPDRGPEAGRDFAARFFGVPGDTVALVGERYQPDVWSEKRSLPPHLPGDPAVHLRTVLEAVDAEDDGAQLCTAFQAMTGQRLDRRQWESSLYDTLSANELVYQLVELLGEPKQLHDLGPELAARVGRDVTAEEILLWLALGAASRREDRPLVRPVVHSFIRGVDGAVVTFPVDRERPRLWLSASDAAEYDQQHNLDEHYRLPVTTCTTCGQHYFVHHLEDFEFTGQVPTGGQRVEDRVVWRTLAETRDGNRLVLLDQLVTDGNDDDDQIDRVNNAIPVWFCRHCGALHPAPRTLCDQCGRSDSLTRLFVVQQRDNSPGYLATCVACGTHGRSGVGGYREPARPVRAVTVSDVHVLAQNMIQRAERKRLLVFADNRQDAAFQAGWMQDHARRFRLRSLMFDIIKDAPISVGDLAHRLNDILEADDSLSQALLPEVWRYARKESSGQRHAEERRRFLRIQILRELTTGVKQRIGLEPWGRIQIEYAGLTTELPLIAGWSKRLELTPDELLNGVASLLDNVRRNAILLDRDHKIFSRVMREGSFEVQRGYIPMLPNVPAGLKLVRGHDDNTSRVKQLMSTSGRTLAVQKALRWGVPKDEVADFIQELWTTLTDDTALLAPITLIGWRDRPLPNCSGTYQIDVDRLLIHSHRGVYRCNVCRRVHPRPTPRNFCMAHNCNGTLDYAQENEDDYDLMVLDQQFELLRPREHSAQVPTTQRETIERIFKGESETINTLVCTPTLELGVDIGALDSVLMRNVPPLPANYWQRVGRAGRRHRMAVNVTYARPASHDRAYFTDPMRLLQGIIFPPRINLRNEIMVQKHVHACILTLLNQLARDKSPLPAHARTEIGETLNDCFPTYVNGYLFINGVLRDEPLDVSGLTRIVRKHETRLRQFVETIFREQWPEVDAEAVTTENLARFIDTMGEELTAVIARLWRRLTWALNQMTRLDDVRRRKGVLDPDEQALHDRCRRLVQRLKGNERSRYEAEGYDDTYTYAVLAAEGFLPGYGLDTGAVIGTAQLSRAYGSSYPDFNLPRPTGVALREYAPGNLIYANGNQFVPRFYHLQPDDGTIAFQVDTANEAVAEVGLVDIDGVSTISAAHLHAVPICDVDMPHQSYINDQEEYRFQMGVATYGYERRRHGGGTMHRWADMDVSLRRAVHLRLVNVGSANLVTSGTLGYPVCTVCGQSRSPLSSDAEVQAFRDEHAQRCGRQVENIGFFADVIADAITIQNCTDREAAYSVAEALRIGATQVLEMESQDVQILTIGHPGQQEVDVILYDPMPGGSGLLDQMIESWPQVVEAALSVVEDCPAKCDVACVDCLLTFRNAYYHRFLDRHLAAELLTTWGGELSESHDIPALLPSTADPDAEMPVNQAESTLMAMLERAGFPSPQAQKAIDLGRPLGGTIPDFYYDDPNDFYVGICIYLDGMSRHIHGNERTQQKDRAIRDHLRNSDYKVIEIRYTQLADRAAMAEHFYQLGRFLIGRSQAQAIRENPSWHNHNPDLGQ